MSLKKYFTIEQAFFGGNFQRDCLMKALNEIMDLDLDKNINNLILYLLLFINNNKDYTIHEYYKKLNFPTLQSFKSFLEDCVKIDEAIIFKNLINLHYKNNIGTFNSFKYLSESLLEFIEEVKI
jgi:hypothetical protein